MRNKMFIAFALCAAFSAGLLAGRSWQSPRGSFHDLIVNHPDDIRDLVAPNDGRVRKLAAALETPENAFLHVRDQIAFDPSLAAGTAGEIIDEGRTSCLGKAILLCSLYRAMGIPASDVRIVTGELAYTDAVVDHAWVDMEYEGVCLQQDATDLIGRFSFGQFRNMEYARSYVRKEWYTFNDKDFVIVSQMNMLKGMGHPPVGQNEQDH